MADVRSLLRSEKASRRITHPQATYSTTGTLVCLICHIQLKSESLWPSHLNSAQHAMRLQRVIDGTLGRPPGAPPPADAAPENPDPEPESVSEPKSHRGPEPASKKRKASASASDSDSHDERRKKPRPKATRTLPTNFFDKSNAPSTDPLITPSAPNRTATEAINEAEYAAFLLETATPPPSPPHAPSALMSLASISAPALSSAEISLRAREVARTQADEQRADVEGEREDAARRLEEEFDAMEAYEARVRALNEQREALRRRLQEVRRERMEGILSATGKSEEGRGEMQAEMGEQADGGEEEEDEDDEDEDGADGWHNWGMR